MLFIDCLFSGAWTSMSFIMLYDKNYTFSFFPKVIVFSMNIFLCVSIPHLCDRIDVILGCYLLMVFFWGVGGGVIFLW